MSYGKATSELLKIFWGSRIKTRSKKYSDDESDHDIVLEMFGSDSETEQLPTVEPVPLVIKIRCGCYAGNWALTQLE